MHITFDKHPELKRAHTILNAITEAGYKPILAGGAPRDLLLGKEVRDFDIFVPVSTWTSHVAKAVVDIVHSVEKLGLSAEIDPEGVYYTAHVYAVLNAGIFQLIFTECNFDSPELLVSEFDATICQALDRNARSRRS